ncbi:MFS transporter [Alteromonas aestuariivivens]|uniref:MFS transporter n=1 Tax=Alteromonas aestuariivivens TaxID=1938339 RepID=A0A3D8MBR5_9ALTE|nr:MFS transporter [Alteromonas aestuariivivens]RDV27466.1 MFS transporter [Alteromonas aestuariivivens]
MSAVKNTGKRRLLAALTLNKLADLLISAKTTLPALLTLAGAPAWMIGWLVPIRESGALLPQAVFGIALRTIRARHWVWRAGMAVQGLMALVMIAAVLFMSPWFAGMTVLLALALFSVARAGCSLTMKDIQAGLVPKGQRGRLIGIAASLSGALTLAIAVPLVVYQPQLADGWLIALVALAALGFACAVLVLWPVKTFVNIEQDGKRVPSLTQGWNFDPVVYRFVLVRGLFVHSALVAPYFMLESQHNAQSLLPVYLAGQALASLTSGFVWGRVADHSARLTLQLAGMLAIAACMGLVILTQASLFQSALLFFVLSVAHSGVRSGRKTFSLDVKDGQNRTELVAFSNTAIGGILLFFGVLYSVLGELLSFSLVYPMSAMLLAGVLLTGFLPDEKKH